MAEVYEEAREKDTPVFLVEYHVDYWDHIGWKDPYGMKTASLRQRDFCKKVGSGVYTPQVVVNGEVSRGGTAAKVRSALSKKPAVKVKLERPRRDKQSGEVVVSFKARGSVDNCTATVALTERGLKSEPDTGECKGMKIEHGNTVRAFGEKKLDGAGSYEVSLEVPDDVDMGNSSLIVYVRTNDKYALRGASWTDLDADSLNTSEPFALMEVVFNSSEPDGNSLSKLKEILEGAGEEDGLVLPVTHLLGDKAEFRSPEERPKELSAEKPFSVFVNSSLTETQELGQRISSALEKPCTTFVEVQCEVKGLRNDRLYVNFRLGQFDGRHELALWLVQKQLELPAGENSIVLENVVIAATRTTARSERDGRKTLTIPDGTEASGLALVAVLLDSKSHEPFAVKKANLVK